MEQFITPPNHKGFSAKKLFDESGKIKWGAIAYIDKNGGGILHSPPASPRYGTRD